MPSLKVVKPGDGSPSGGDRSPSRPRRPASVRAAAETGDRKQLLVALRSRIARDIDNPSTPSRDLAALSRRLLEIARELEMLAAEDKVDDIGEAAATPDQEWASS